MPLLPVLFCFILDALKVFSLFLVLGKLVVPRPGGFSFVFIFHGGGSGSICSQWAVGCFSCSVSVLPRDTSVTPVRPPDGARCWPIPAVCPLRGPLRPPGAPWWGASPGPAGGTVPSRPRTWFSKVPLPLSSWPRSRACDDWSQGFNVLGPLHRSGRHQACTWCFYVKPPCSLTGWASAGSGFLNPTSSFTWSVSRHCGYFCHLALCLSPPSGCEAVCPVSVLSVAPWNFNEHLCLTKCEAHPGICPIPGRTRTWCRFDCGHYPLGFTVLVLGSLVVSTPQDVITPVMCCRWPSVSPQLLRFDGPFLPSASPTSTLGSPLAPRHTGLSTGSSHVAAGRRACTWLEATSAEPHLGSDTRPPRHTQ